jgi:uncharacterized SAM-dependent methyltransferase
MKRAEEVVGRLSIVESRVVAAQSGDFGRDVARGLGGSPKRLDCVYFYDEEGSDLFEAICALPEYYLTRAEAEILARVR